MTMNPTGAGPGAWVYRGENEPMSAVLARNWWAVGLRGVAAILFGLAALLTPGLTMLFLVALFAVYMFFDAVFALVSAIRAAGEHSDRWPLLILEAIVGFAIAAVTLVWPGLTVLGFIVLAAAWAFLTGGLAIAAAFRLKRDHGRWLLAISGVLAVILGVMLAFSPVIGAVVLTWWLGAYALAFGVSLLALAFQLYGHRADHLHRAPVAHA
jgi:uncharacterized membrane protein HdeD (DUF308 family)